MTAAVEHPRWCDRARCTVELDPQLGAHRSKPVRLSGGPMATTLGLFHAAGASLTLVELHLGRLDDVSEEASTAVGLLTGEAAVNAGRMLSRFGREAVGGKPNPGHGGGQR